MKTKIKHVTLWNAGCSLLLQLVTIFSGFIIPRCILNLFGSEANGLVSSINQFLNYVALFEGGLSSVIMASFYKPLHDNDQNKISSIVKTTQHFYKKLSYIFLGYSFLLALVYPFFCETTFSYSYLFSLTIILAIQIFVQYHFAISWKLLLNADKKVYLVSLIQIFFILLNTILFVVLSTYFPNLHFLKFVSALVYFLQPLLYHLIVKKYFQFSASASVSSQLLKSRWDGFSTSIAAFIHKNTDITILTFFTNLKVVSVYSVYSLVTNGLRQVITSFSAGIIPTLGHSYAKNDPEELKQIFSFYEFIIFFSTFFCFTVGGLLITPFVLLYTRHVTDIYYQETLLGVLLVLAEGIFCLKEPFVNLSYAANRFKDIKKHAYIEAFLNMFFSILLVFPLGVNGVALGTLIAMTYRTLYHVFYLKKEILYRPIKFFFKKLFWFSLASVLGIFCCRCFFPILELTVFSWLKAAVLYSCILFVLYLIISWLFFAKDWEIIKVFLKKNKKKLTFN